MTVDGPARVRADTSSEPDNHAASLAWALVALYVVASGFAIYLDIQVYREFAPPEVGILPAVLQRGFFLGPFVLFPAVGALIVSRRKRNTVGWLMLLAGSMLAVAGVAATYASFVLGGATGDPPLFGLVAKWVEMPLLMSGFVIALVVVPLVFPTGRPPSRRWRAVIWGGAAVVALALAHSLLAPNLTGSLDTVTMERSIELYEVINPIGVSAAARLTGVASAGQTVMLMVLSVAVVTAIGVRFRRSSGTERQQLKWFLFAVSVVAATMATIILTRLVPGIGSPTWLWGIVTVAGFAGYPVAIGVAVLRYRLYEIDRIISRTVSYGLIVAILGAVYVGAVAGLGAAVSALTGAGGSDLAVALSTLLAVGLFQPVRTRVQTAVDRRFNRTGYDARQAVEAFARDVRDEVDLDRIRQQVAQSAAAAVQPTQVSVWVRGAREGHAP